MIVGVPSETFPGERRVALTPRALGPLQEAGLSVHVQADAGESAGFPDERYEEAGATIVPDRAEAFAADIICQVRTPGANPGAGAADLELLRAGQALIGHAEPLTAHDPTRAVADRGVTLLAMELIPRITRAQAMDALSSQANIAGYKAVIIAAHTLPRMFPMMMTAAGTIQPARVFVVGAGVAGLQAIATAKRLGSSVSAIDVRPAVREQVESLGARFVMIEDLMAEGEGGYAKEQTEDQKRRQQELMARTVAESDVVVTTAAIPGRPAPRLLTEAMVRSMKPRSVIVDLAAERGGNCELTEPDRVVERHGVTIVGTGNIPATVPHDASRMYANNIAKLLLHLTDEAKLVLNTDDPITAGALVCRDGGIVHPQVRRAMGLSDEPSPAAKGGG